MKYILLISLFFVSSITKMQAQGYDKNCFYGITFEMSKNPNWGNGELVITGVEPNSPAEKGGIKVGDIIMEINGKATFLRDNQTIAEWLFDVDDPIVNFTIRNMNTYFKEYPLHRKCINTNSISEKELADLYSFYSLEDTRRQSFTLPLSIDVNDEIDFTDYHTYDFFKDEDSAPIDANIMAILEKGLTERGLVRNTSNPDMIIQTYFSFEPNPDYNATIANAQLNKLVSRYDTDKQEMVQLPIFDSKATNISAVSPFIYKIGFGMYTDDKKSSDDLIQIWDSNIKDYVSNNYSFEEYVRIHMPLMMMQFPYARDKNEVRYEVSFDKYNYTGIYFDTNDLITVRDVDYDSPAYKAGIRPGYVIKKMDNKAFNHNKSSLTEGYTSFISETMPYRDASTRFTNAHGYTECMFWDKKFYSDVAKALNNQRYTAGFSYLFGFEKYVNNKTPETIAVEVSTGSQHRSFMVRPIITKSVVIKAIY